MASRDWMMILFFTVFSAVMILTGSLLINLFEKSSQSVQDESGFHWTVGLVSIIGGCLSAGVSLMFLVYPTKSEKVKKALA